MLQVQVYSLGHSGLRRTPEFSAEMDTQLLNVLWGVGWSHRESHKGCWWIFLVPASCPTRALNSLKPEPYLLSLPEGHCSVVSCLPIPLSATTSGALSSSDPQPSYLFSIRFLSTVDGTKISYLKALLPFSTPLWAYNKIVPYNISYNLLREEKFLWCWPVYLWSEIIPPTYLLLPDAPCLSPWAQAAFWTYSSTASA